MRFDLFKDSCDLSGLWLCVLLVGAIIALLGLTWLLAGLLQFVGVVARYWF